MCAKRTWAALDGKKIRETYLILLKLWISGTCRTQEFTIRSNCTVRDLRKILTDTYNPTKSAKLMLMLQSYKLTSGYDNRLVTSLEGFSKDSGTGITIHAIFKPGNFEQSLETIVENSESSDVHKYLKVVQILNRNAKTCAEDARENRSPLERERFDQPEEPIAKRPKVADFAKCTLDVSDTLFQLSKSMKDLSNKLAEGSSDMDPSMDHLLRNNMDTCRYLAPLLQSLSSISVPNLNPQSELGLDLAPKPFSDQSARRLTPKAL
jgi:hypothetical protein